MQQAAYWLPLSSQAGGTGADHGWAPPGENIIIVDKIRSDWVESYM